jgi:hypothetical protein
MNLLDGLNRYTKEPAEWKLTQDTEATAREVRDLVCLYGDKPTAAALASSHALLVEIEKWKAMCLKERMVNAAQNSERDVWEAFRGALNAQSNLQCILSIMRLKGFGSVQDEETGQRRAKVATAVLRFLKPEEWGVVDWRTIAMLGNLEKSNGDVDQALMLSRRENPNDLRKWLDIVDENWACEVNRKYRAMRTSPPVSRAADIDMALFGLSLIAWPMPS